MSMQDKTISDIAICVINYNSFGLAKYCIENLIKKTHLPISLYVYDMDIESDINKVEYFNDLNAKYFRVNGKTLNEVKSMFMLESTEDYLCIVPISCLVGRNWLEDLLHNYSQCQSTGILSIKNQTTICELSVLPYNNDEKELVLSNVWLGEKNFVSGIMFFDKKISNNLYPLMFGRDSNINAYADDEMSFVSNLLGKNNFYILKQNIVHLEIENDILFPKKTFENTIEFRKYANELAKANK
jgi:hypothetical protein